MLGLEPLTLLKAEPTPYSFRADATSREMQLELELVLGVALSDSAPVLYPATNAEDVPAIEEVQLPAGMPARIYSFYETRLTGLAFLMGGSHDCHSFAKFATGAEATPTISPDTPRSEYAFGPTVNPEALEAGKHYGIFDSSSKIVHSILGINRPSQSLGVIAKNLGLVVANNNELCDFYAGQSIRTVTAIPAIGARICVISSGHDTGHAITSSPVVPGICRPSSRVAT